MNAQRAVHQLLHDPDYFLKHYPVITAGANVAHVANQANIMQFWLSKRDPLVPGAMPSANVGHYGATRPGRILSSRIHEISSFQIITFATPGADTQQINAHSVPMIPYNHNAPINLQQLAPYFLDGASDGVMITGQLSGCCFCWLPVGAQLWCTHIRPLNPPNFGVQLQNLLHMGGRFNGHVLAPLGTFGRNEYPQHATVIGVRLHGNWRLYAQVSNDQNRTNALVYRFYPGARVVL